ncbi:MAG: DUF2934 domain-containing protein [Chlorobiaceae bacterium]|nr:DUF2934 domain-containing protein [Chlorobiaceae bacterium]
MAKGSNKAEEPVQELYEEVESAPEQLEEEIRLTAYYLWESKGRGDGSDVEDWLTAEELVKD